MGNQRRAGVVYFKADGQIYDAKGNFTYNLGTPKREAIIGADVVHGYAEKIKVPFIEGEITDRGSLDVAAFQKLTNVTATLELANGKVVVLRNAWYAGEGDIKTEEANIAVRFEGLSAEEVLAAS